MHSSWVLRIPREGRKEGRIRRKEKEKEEMQPASCRENACNTLSTPALASLPDMHFPFKFEVGGLAWTISIFATSSGYTNL